MLRRGFGLLTPNMQRPAECALEIAKLGTTTEAPPLGSCSLDIGMQPSKDLSTVLPLMLLYAAGWIWVLSVHKSTSCSAETLIS